MKLIGKKSVLSVALDNETFQRMAPILKRRTFSVSMAQQASEAITMADNERFDLVICRYPLPDMKVREFVTSLRRSASASRRASLMLLTIPEMRSEARSGISGGPYLVFSQQEPLGNLHEGAAQLLEVAPRHAPRIKTRVRVSMEQNSESFEAWIVNLSITGMLVTESKILEIGSNCFFEFTLPGEDQPTRGSAEVVRHADPKNEGLNGFGMRFLNFEEGCQENLNSWCEYEMTKIPES